MLNDMLRKVKFEGFSGGHLNNILDEVGYANNSRGAWQAVLSKWKKIAGNTTPLYGVRIGDRVMFSKEPFDLVNNW